MSALASKLRRLASEATSRQDKIRIDRDFYIATERLRKAVNAIKNGGWHPISKFDSYIDQKKCISSLEAAGCIETGDGTEHTAVMKLALKTYPKEYTFPKKWIRLKNNWSYGVSEDQYKSKYRKRGLLAKLSGKGTRRVMCAYKDKQTTEVVKIILEAVTGREQKVQSGGLRGLLQKILYGGSSGDPLKVFRDHVTAAMSLRSFDSPKVFDVALSGAYTIFVFDDVFDSELAEMVKRASKRSLKKILVAWLKTDSVYNYIVPICALINKIKAKKQKVKKEPERTPDEKMQAKLDKVRAFLEGPSLAFSKEDVDTILKSFDKKFVEKSTVEKLVRAVLKKYRAKGKKSSTYKSASTWNTAEFLALERLEKGPIYQDELATLIQGWAGGPLDRAKRLITDMKVHHRIRIVADGICEITVKGREYLETIGDELRSIRTAAARPASNDWTYDVNVVKGRSVITLQHDEDPVGIPALREISKISATKLNRAIISKVYKLKRYAGVSNVAFPANTDSMTVEIKGIVNKDDIPKLVNRISNFHPSVVAGKVLAKEKDLVKPLTSKCDTINKYIAK